MKDLVMNLVLQFLYTLGCIFRHFDLDHDFFKALFTLILLKTIKTEIYRGLFLREDDITLHGYDNIDTYTIITLSGKQMSNRGQRTLVSYPTVMKRFNRSIPNVYCCTRKENLWVNTEIQVVKNRT